MQFYFHIEIFDQIVSQWQSIENNLVSSIYKMFIISIYHCRMRRVRFSIFRSGSAAGCAIGTINGFWANSLCHIPSWRILNKTERILYFTLSKFCIPNHASPQLLSTASSILCLDCCFFKHERHDLLAIWNSWILISFSIGCRPPGSWLMRTLLGLLL